MADTIPQIIDSYVMKLTSLIRPSILLFLYTFQAICFFRHYISSKECGRFLRKENVATFWCRIKFTKLIIKPIFFNLSPMVDIFEFINWNLSNIGTYLGNHKVNGTGNNGNWWVSIGFYLQWKRDNDIL